MNKVLVEAYPASKIRSPLLYLLVLLVMFCCAAKAQQSVVLGWDPTTNTPVAGYLVFCGTSTHNYTVTNDVGTNTIATIANLQLGSNYFFTVSSYTAGGTQSVPADELQVSIPISPFLDGQQAATNGADWLQFTNGTAFGYFEVLTAPWIHHDDMGYEYLIDANDQQGGIYFFDWDSNTYWYTSPSLYPYLYDFTLNSWLYYYPDVNNPGHYTTNPRRFYNYTTQLNITK